MMGKGQAYQLQQLPGLVGAVGGGGMADWQCRCRLPAAGPPLRRGSREPGSATTWPPAGSSSTWPVLAVDLVAD